MRVSEEEKILTYFKHKPACYRKGYECDNVDKEDDNQVADPGQPALGGVLKKKKKENININGEF